MKNETDTITVLLAVALEVTEAVLVLAVALVALVLTVARWRPSQASSTKKPLLVPDTSPARTPHLAGVTSSTRTPHLVPLHHPLALVAEQLEALPVAALRPMVGTRSKRLRKSELVAMVAACC